MSDFTTPEGWREVLVDESENNIEVIQHWIPDEGKWRTYIREADL